MPNESAATAFTVQCATCRQAFGLDGDAAEILAVRLAAGGVIPCLADGCTGTCQPPLLA